MEYQANKTGDQLIRCPFCASAETEPTALFGSLLLLTQHYCRACRSSFERVRDDDPAGDAGESTGAHDPITC